MKTRRILSRLPLLFLAVLMSQTVGCGGGGASSPGAGSGTWTGALQVGTASFDDAIGIATDSLSNVYIAGRSDGDIDNCGCLNPMDGFVAKFGPAGEMEWLYETEADGTAAVRAVAVGPYDHVYAGGHTDRDLNGTGIAGGTDLFFYKLDAGGNLEWIRQAGSAGDDFLYAMASDPSGNVFLAGDTTGNLDGSVHTSGWDAFAMLFDRLGERKWTYQFGPSSAGGIAADASSNVYVVGGLPAPYGGWDAFVAKLDPNGTLAWIRYLGTAESDSANAVAADPSGNVYVTGCTRGDLGGARNAGGADVFLAKYTSDGTEVWTRILGTPEDDSGRALAADREGNVYVAGTTNGDLAGASKGGNDAILVKYDGSGNRLWTRQYGTGGEDYFKGIAFDPEGNPVVAGATNGEWDGCSHRGDFDAIVVKFDPDGTLH